MQLNVSGHPRPEIGLYVLGALPPHEEDELEAHLAACAVCIGEANELGLVIDLLQSSITAEDLGELTGTDINER
jgi:anti-sigma factor RsiW